MVPLDAAKAKRMPKRIYEESVRPLRITDMIWIGQELEFPRFPGFLKYTPVLRDPVRWLLNTGSLAMRASTRPGEALSLLKNISTRQTPEGFDNQLFPLGCQGACNMRKMLIDLFFPDTYRLG